MDLEVRNLNAEDAVCAEENVDTKTFFYSSAFSAYSAFNIFLVNKWTRKNAC